MAESRSLSVKLNVAPDGGGDMVEHAYRQYWKELCAFVRRSFGTGPPEPEDVAQAAFTSFAAAGGSAAIINPRAFLYRSAANFVINHRRHGAVCNRHAVDELQQNPAADRDEITPEIVLLDKEQLAIVERAIRAMPAKRRRYLLLNRLDGLGYTEIARREGLTESAVRSQVAKAALAIAEALKAAEEDDD